jgi:hypothetical protein
LAKVAAKKAVILPDVFFQVIEDLSVKTVEPKPRMVNIIQGEEWRASITAYLRNHYEPDSRAEMIRIQQRVKAYQIIEEELYKTSVTRPCLRCSSKDEGKEMLNQTGPFVVTEKTWLGSFRLADNEGRVLEHSWNADNLHRFFI